MGQAGGRLQLRLKSLRVQRVCLKRAALNTFSLEAPREHQAWGGGEHTCGVHIYVLNGVSGGADP